MAWRTDDKDLLVDVITSISNKVLEDKTISELGEGVVFDFDFTDVALNPAPRQPRDVPRMYIIPTGAVYDPESTCNNKLDFTCSIVLEGFHVRNRKAYQLAWRLLYFLRYLPYYVEKVDEHEFGVLCVPGDGHWEYDADRQTISYSIDLTVTVRL